MPQYENIEGHKLIAHFQAMIKDKTFLQVSLPEGDYDNLTVVTEIVENGKQLSFCIDSPKGLQQAIGKTESPLLFFEFNSDDRVTHRFRSTILSVSEGSIVCEFPQHIQRHQQRDNFRVKTLYQSQAILHIDNTEIQMEIDNVSLGGVYCYCQTQYRQLFEEKAKLPDMELAFTLREECFRIPIQRVQVNRVEMKHRPKQFGIAFEFIRIGREARRHLVQQIYELQREFLQNRLKIME
jgi:c-di-GMP-binding flagellar brake protein YcgR